MTHPAVEIRLATAADVDEVARILELAFREYRDSYTPEAYAATVCSPESILERMGEGPVWMAALADVDVATVSALLTESGCHVRGMGATPAARGHEIGRLLLETVEQRAHDSGATRLYLSTTPFLDRAIRLYERFGFTRTDDGPHELLGTPLFTMVKPL